MIAAHIIAELESLGTPRNIEGMRRFKVFTSKAFGVPMPQLRALAKRCGPNLSVAQQLWASGWHEARIIATLIAPISEIDEILINKWVEDLDSWAICDAFTANLVRHTSFAWPKTAEWAKREEEFVKRAAFSLIAGLAISDKTSPDTRFLRLFPLIKRGSTDDRDFVKKSVSWALRQIGKRNPPLRGAAIAVAREIKLLDTKSARCIASDVLRELERK